MRPGRLGDRRDEEIRGGLPAGAVARDQLKYAVAELSTHDNQRVTKALNDGLQAALTGTKTPEQAHEGRAGGSRPHPRRISTDKRRRAKACRAPRHGGKTYTATRAFKQVVRSREANAAMTPEQADLDRRPDSRPRLAAAAARVVLLALFTHWPAVATLIDSFFSTPQARAAGASSSASTTTATMLGDPIFWQALWNNLLFRARHHSRLDRARDR